MAITVHIIPRVIRGDETKVNNEGDLEATRNFLVFFKGGSNDSVALVNGLPVEAAVLNAVDNDNSSLRIPKWGDRLLSGSIAGVGNAYVTDITVTPVKEDDPWQYLVVVNYGKNPKSDSDGNEQPDQDDEEEAKPEEERDKYPWEEKTSISADFGNGPEEVPDIAALWEDGVGGMPLADVIAEKRDPASGIFTNGNMVPLMNSAGDFVQNPPTRPIKAGTVNLSFSLKDITGWTISDFLDKYLHKVNLSSVVVGATGHIFGNWNVPAGTLKIVGFTCENKHYVENKKWRSKTEHPFGYKGTNGVTLVNTSKFDITVERSFEYFQITIKMDYSSVGHLIYIQDMGFREWKDGANGLTPIKDINGDDVKSPYKLDGSGHALHHENEDVLSGMVAYFIKYRYYDYINFDFVQLIPWLGQNWKPSNTGESNG